MKKEFTILVADRNPRVRSLLKRELTLEGYRVLLAQSCRDVVRAVFQPDAIDLIILDPDLPDAEEVELMEKIFNRVPQMPVIIHAFISEHPELMGNWHPEAFVEKSADSLERLISKVSTLFTKSSAP